MSADTVENSPQDNPILNSPYSAPELHWELTDEGGFSQTVRDGRRRSAYYVPVAPKGRKSSQAELDFSMEDAAGRAFLENALVNGVREQVDRWRREPAMPISALIRSR